MGFARRDKSEVPQRNRLCTRGYLTLRLAFGQSEEVTISRDGRFSSHTNRYSVPADLKEIESIPREERSSASVAP